MLPVPYLLESVVLYLPYRSGFVPGVGPRLSFAVLVRVREEDAFDVALFARRVEQDGLDVVLRERLRRLQPHPLRGSVPLLKKRSELIALRVR
jgi:hypothetical protein